MTTKLGILYYNLVTYYRDKIEKEPEFKTMITGHIRPPFRDNPQDSKQQITKTILQAQEDIDDLLKHKTDFTPETQLKLSVEKRFLRIREVYYRVFARIL